MKTLLTIGLLVLSNAFMTLAWYGHLKFTKPEKAGILGIVLISWGIAFFEYCLQVPANRIGFRDTGGPFTLLQLKLTQEVISILVFIIFTLLVFRGEPIKWNHVVSFILIVAAVYFAYLK